MNKMIKIVALLVTAVMLISMMSVVSFAEAQIYTKPLVKVDGVINENDSYEVTDISASAMQTNHVGNYMPTLVYRWNGDKVGPVKPTDTQDTTNAPAVKVYVKQTDDKFYVALEEIFNEGVTYDYRMFWSFVPSAETTGHNNTITVTANGEILGQQASCMIYATQLPSSNQTTPFSRKADAFAGVVLDSEVAYYSYDENGYGAKIITDEAPTEGRYARVLEMEMDKDLLITTYGKGTVEDFKLWVEGTVKAGETTTNIVYGTVNSDGTPVLDCGIGSKGNAHEQSKLSGSCMYVGPVAISVGDVASEPVVDFYHAEKNTVEIVFGEAAADVAATDREVYSVNVEWENLEFVYYKAGVRYEWDPNELKYVEADAVASDHWDKASAKIKVTNLSNAAINVAAAFTEENSGYGISEDIDLASAAGDINDITSKGTPVEGFFTVTPPEYSEEMVLSNGIILTIS